MKGIIYKDFLALLVPKHTFSILADIAVAIPIIFFFKNIYGLALTCLLLIPMTGTSLLQISMEQDEQSQFDKLQLTFPMTKKEIILSKYIAGLMFMGIFAIVSLGLALFQYSVLNIADLTTCLQIWAAGLAVGVIFLSFSYVGFFLLGNKKGTIVYIVMAIASAIIYVIGFFNFDVMSIFNMNHNVLIGIVALIALVLLAVSYTISVKIYTKRYS